MVDTINISGYEHKTCYDVGIIWSRVHTALGKGRTCAVPFLDSILFLTGILDEYSHELARFPRHGASGVLYLSWPSSRRSLTVSLASVKSLASETRRKHPDVREVRGVFVRYIFSPNRAHPIGRGKVPCATPILSRTGDCQSGLWYVPFSVLFQPRVMEDDSTVYASRLDCPTRCRISWSQRSYSYSGVTCSCPKGRAVNPGLTFCFSPRLQQIVGTQKTFSAPYLWVVQRKMPR